METKVVKCPTCSSDMVELKTVGTKHPSLIKIHTICSSCKKENFLKFSTNRAFDLEVQLHALTAEIDLAHELKRASASELYDELYEELEQEHRRMQQGLL